MGVYISTAFLLSMHFQMGITVFVVIIIVLVTMAFSVCLGADALITVLCENIILRMSLVDTIILDWTISSNQFPVEVGFLRVDHTLNVSACKKL